jgi:hypothetical protein
VRPVGTPWGSDGGWVGQGGAVGFSPETAGGGGAEKMTQRGDRAPVDGEGVDKSYSWRRGQGRWGTVQKGWMTGAWWSSPRGGGKTMAWRHEDGATAAVQSASVDTRPRKERRG